MTTYFYRHGAEAQGKKIHECSKPSSHTKEVVRKDNCWRCGGAGGSQAWIHTGWTCYLCGGTGKGPQKWVKVYTAEKLAKLVAAQEKRDAKKAEKQAVIQAEKDAIANAERVVFTQDNQDLVEWLEAYQGKNEFIQSQVQKLEQYGHLTSGQVTAVQKNIDQEAQEAVAADVIEGKVEITGKILTIKGQPGFAYNTTDWKMLVLDDRGFKVWGSHPRSINETQQGDRISFTANITQSDNDSKFGFFKRPTKAIAI